MSLYFIMIVWMLKNLFYFEIFINLQKVLENLKDDVDLGYMLGVYGYKYIKESFIFLDFLWYCIDLCK